MANTPVAHRPIVGPTRVAFGSTGQGLEGVLPNRPPSMACIVRALTPTVAFLLAHATWGVVAGIVGSTAAAAVRDARPKVSWLKTQETLSQDIGNWCVET